MIRISNSGTILEVRVDIPKGLNQGKDEVFRLTTELGGSDVAVTALAEHLQTNLSRLISQIRREAYRQGAKDRAFKAKEFSGYPRTGLGAGGCWQ